MPKITHHRATLSWMGVALISAASPAVAEPPRFWPEPIRLPASTPARNPSAAKTPDADSFSPAAAMPQVPAPAWPEVPRPTSIRQALVLMKDAVPVYSRERVSPISAVRLIDDQGMLYSTEAGGLLTFSDFEFAVPATVGTFHQAELASQVQHPIELNASPVEVTATYKALGYVTKAALKVSYRLPPGFMLRLDGAPGRPGSPGRPGEAGRRGANGADARCSGCDGKPGEDGAPGKNGSPGANGSDGGDAADVLVAVKEVSSPHEPAGLWEYTWQQADKKGRLLTLPGATFTLSARGGDGGAGGAGGDGGPGGDGGDGGDGAKGSTGASGKAGRQGYAGSRGTAASADSPAGMGTPGGPGTDGTRGSRGGSGGDGGQGKNGGAGGHGGAGGAGGSAGHGARVVVYAQGPAEWGAKVKSTLRVITDSGKPGPGGQAGAPGAGGAPGRAGAAGEGGEGGSGGPGGRGGEGGPGGYAYSGIRYIGTMPVATSWPSGYQGPSGRSGRDGDDGPRGAAGSAGTRGQRGNTGSPGAIGPTGASSYAGKVIHSDEQAYAREEASRAEAAKQFEQARKSGKGSAIIDAAIRRADTLAPDNNASGNAAEARRVLSEGVSAGGEELSTDDLARLLQKQQELRKKEKK